MIRFICLLLLIFSACSGSDSPPKGLLSEEKMAAVLTDIHISEARVSNLKIGSMDSSLLVFQRMEENIWKKHKVDTLKYKESYAFYVSHPEQMERIYEKVIKKLELYEKKKGLKL